jgi:hypothetical protein
MKGKSFSVEITALAFFSLSISTKAARAKFADHWEGDPCSPLDLRKKENKFILFSDIVHNLKLHFGR